MIILLFLQNTNIYKRMLEMKEEKEIEIAKKYNKTVKWNTKSIVEAIRELAN